MSPAEERCLRRERRRALTKFMSRGRMAKGASRLRVKYFYRRPPSRPTSELRRLDPLPRFSDEDGDPCDYECQCADDQIHCEECEDLWFERWMADDFLRPATPLRASLIERTGVAW